MSDENRSGKGDPASPGGPSGSVDPEAATRIATKSPEADGDADAAAPTRVDVPGAEDGARQEPEADRGATGPADPAPGPTPTGDPVADAETVVRPRPVAPQPPPDPAASTGEPEVSGSAPGTRALAPDAAASDSGLGDVMGPTGIERGSILFGEYEIVEVLGAGGMGEVYRARHRRLGEYRAIKMMHADLASKQGANEFFLREAKALLAVRHPAVVHCHDLLSDERGRVFLIMEMIEGVSLGERIAESALPADQVVLLGARLSAGLRAAHGCGVVHRDVSPDNVVLPNGEVEQAKLIDFGIAKILEEGQGTIVDGFKGKLSYASPEQLGFFGGRIDGRSDFYSLGLVLCAAALGRPMGMGTTVVEAVDARRGFQHVPETIPIGLRSSIEPLLALDPRDRPDNPEPLFLAPGGDQLGLEAIREEASRRPTGSVSAGLGWLRGAAAVFAITLALAGYWLLGPRGGAEGVPTEGGLGGEATSSEGRAPTPETAVTRPAADTAAGSADGDGAVDTVAVAPKRRPSALDAVRIVGLLRGAETALSENRLQSPKGDNAYEKYRSVLALDPDNPAARRGLVAVADRYLRLSERALGRSEVERARTYLARASAIAPHHPDLEEVRAEVETAESE